MSFLQNLMTMGVDNPRQQGVPFEPTSRQKNLGYLAPVMLGMGQSLLSGRPVSEGVAGGLSTMMAMRQRDEEEAKLLRQEQEESARRQQAMDLQQGFFQTMMQPRAAPNLSNPFGVTEGQGIANDAMAALGRAPMAGQGLPETLIQSESGGSFTARNDVPGAGGVGHFGRGQFSRARLDEARAAGVMPADMTPEQYLQSPELQQRVEQWHVQDVGNFIREQGLDQFIGQNIGGTMVTPSGMLAAAHLGGKEGLRRFLTSGGRYNPQDVNGTSLMDYLRQHGGGRPQIDPQRAAAIMANPDIPAGVKQMVMAQIMPEEQETEGFRLATAAEAERYGVPGQIGPDGRFYPLKTEPETVVNVGGGEPFAQDFWEDRYKKLQNAALGAETNIEMYDIAQTALDSGLRTGFGAETEMALRRIGQSMGLDTNPEKIAAGELLTTVQNRMALMMRNPDSGMGMPGAVSDRDLKFLKDSQIGMDRTPEGNRRMLAAFRAIEQRKLEMAELADLYLKKNKRLDAGFNAMVREYAEANPLFTPETIGAPQDEGATYDTFENFSADPEVQEKAAEYGVTVQEMWEVLQEQSQ